MLKALEVLLPIFVTMGLGWGRAGRGQLHSVRAHPVCRRAGPCDQRTAGDGYLVPRRPLHRPLVANPALREGKRDPGRLRSAGGQHCDRAIHDGVPVHGSRTEDISRNEATVPRILRKTRSPQ